MKWWPGSSAQPAWAVAVLGAAAAVLAAVLQAVPAVQRTDQRLHDAVLAETTPRAAPVELALVDIDEQSLALLGPWPWPRTVLAQMSQRLREQGATLQVWDMLLSHPTAADEAVAPVLGRPDVLFGQVPVIDPQVLTPPREGRLMGQPQASAGLPCSQGVAVNGHLGLSPSLAQVQVGHIAARPSADGRLRAVPAVICHEGQALPQLTLAAAALDEPSLPWSLEPARFGAEGHTLRRGRWAFALDAQGWLTVPYDRPHRQWPVIRAEQLLDPDAAIPSLKGRVVLVGATALGLGDVISTPREALAPGVSVHAELLAAGLNPAAWPLKPAQPPVLAAVLAAALALMLLLVARGATPRRMVLAGVAAAAAPWALAAGARTLGWLWPAAAPSVALAGLAALCVVAYAVQMRLEGQKLRRHLESFIPASLASRVVAHQRPGESLGEPRTGVVLALRITGIERWMAKVDPQKALGLLHAVHAAAQLQAASQGGRVDHAQGHTLLVVWPQASAASTRSAVGVAHACWAELLPLLRSNELDNSPLGLEAAVEAGDYWVGVVGAAESRRPVVLGAAVVDVMAMLELHAELAAPILVGERASGLLSADAAPTSAEPTAPAMPPAHAAHPRPAIPVAPAAAWSGSFADLSPLGRFVLPGQARSKALHRVEAPLPAA